MDLIYTYSSGEDKGVLKNYTLDFDTNDKKDFQITTGIANNVMEANGLWYVEGTEYGGMIDNVEVRTNSNELVYSGRNFRGILNSKIVMPPEGQPYLILTGNASELVQNLIVQYGLDSIFSVSITQEYLTEFKVNRFDTLLDVIISIAYAVDKVVRFNVNKGVVFLKLVSRIDYSDDIQYRTNEINFDVKKSYSTVNHLVCLGQGELLERQVYHLYVNDKKEITTEQYYFNRQEVTDKYENTSAETLDDLIDEGKKRLSELINTDSFELTLSGNRYKIGDVISCFEPITGFSVTREISNMIVKIKNGSVDIDYTVGGEAVKGASTPAPDTDTYVLPIATRTTLGGIKVGKTLDIENGALNAIRAVNNIISSQAFKYLQNV